MCHTIYLLTNKVNGRQYVGQTKFTAAVRWAQHRSLAKRRGGCMLLNRAINKYGSDAFDVQTLLECEKEVVDDFESMFIDIYDTVGKRGYNIQRGGRHSTHSAETKAKMSRWHKDSGSAVAVSQWTLGGQHVREYESATDAAKAVNGKRGNILAVARGHAKSAFGYMWTLAGASPPPVYRRSKRTGQSRPVAQLGAGGTVLAMFPSIKTAAAAVGRTAVPILKCAMGQTRQSGGFAWKFV